MGIDVGVCGALIVAVGGGTCTCTVGGGGGGTCTVVSNRLVFLARGS